LFFFFSFQAFTDICSLKVVFKKKEENRKDNFFSFAVVTGDRKIIVKGWYQRMAL
jgi:hypothetical protein